MSLALVPAALAPSTQPRPAKEKWVTPRASCLFLTLIIQPPQYARLGDVYWIAEEEDEFGYVMKLEFHNFKVAYKLPPYHPP